MHTDGMPHSLDLQWVSMSWEGRYYRLHTQMGIAALAATLRWSSDYENNTFVVLAIYSAIIKYGYYSKSGLGQRWQRWPNALFDRERLALRLALCLVCWAKDVEPIEPTIILHVHIRWADEQNDVWSTILLKRTLRKNKEKFCSEQSLKIINRFLLALDTQAALYYFGYFLTFPCGVPGSSADLLPIMMTPDIGGVTELQGSSSRIDWP